MYVHAMLSFNNTNHHPSDTPSKWLGGTYKHACHIKCTVYTVYCHLKYLGYTVFSNPYLSVYL